ncbi:MAG: MarR family transcriptional regulator [Gammaproteobacteria bacterium]|nr:MarR family transcriptional regulator [Gammaproteobacteria bacterium]
MKSLIPNEAIRRILFSKLSEQVPNFDFAAVQLSAQLLMSSQQTIHLFENHFAQWGLSQGRFAILMLLYNLPENDWTPVKLAEATCVTKATVTGLVNNLSRDGYITRQQHPDDGRKISLRLSESGEQFVQGMIPQHFEQISQIYSNLDGQQIKQICDALTLLQQVIIPGAEKETKQYIE